MMRTAPQWLLLATLAFAFPSLGTAAPAAPTGFTVAAQPGGAVALAWTDAATNEENYVVSRGASAGGPFNDIATLPGGATSYRDVPPGSPARRFYQVRAVNGTGSSAPAGPAEAVTFQLRYRWRSVAIGGGGYITGLYPHPTEANLVYARTDVGGFYRWSAAETRWVPITDHFTLEQRDFYAGEALAIDPQDPDVVFIACGNAMRFGALFKSTDRGATWTQLPIGGFIEMHGNGTYRYAGERLVVSPHSSQVVFFGTRGDGLRRSLDGGASWAKLTGLPDSAWSYATGITGVLCDPGAAGVVYAATPGSGVWRSADNGGSWTQLSGAPANVNRMAIAAGGALLATHAGGVSRYAGGTWTTSVPTGATGEFCAISANPANRNDVIVAERNTAGGSKTWRSADGGATWGELLRNRTSTVPWLDSYRRSNPALASLEFDPAVPGRVWLSDWFGVWRTEDINAATPQFTNPMRNLEEMVVFTLAAPASGAPLLSGVADNDGFRHTDLEAFPAGRYSSLQETHSLAVFAGDSARIVRAAGGRSGPYHVAISQDGGANWANTNWNTAVPNTRALQVAFAASDATNLVAVTDSSTGNGLPRFSTDGGATWQTVSGLPAGPNSVWNVSLPLAADAQLADTFYYHHAATGAVYRSTDKGATFTQRNAVAPLPPATHQVVLRARPGASGELWTCLDGGGLHRSTDGGATFASLPGVTRAFCFAFGKAPTGSTTPALYLYGAINGSGFGVFRTLDLGATWTELTDPAVAMGNGPGVMEASAQTYGLVFVGTSGRGIFYGEPLPVVTATATDASASEMQGDTGTLRFDRTGDSSSALAVNATLGGTAVRGTDYTTPLVGAFTFLAGSPFQTAQVTPIPDSLVEGSETVTFTIDPGAGYLVGTPSSATVMLGDKGFDDWRFTRGIGASPEAADLDGDGRSNLLEYAVGSEPLIPGPPTAPVITRANGALSLTYQRLRIPAEIAYAVEVSSNLVDWESGPAFVEETNVFGTVTARDLNPAGAPQRFIRLRVTRQP